MDILKLENFFANSSFLFLFVSMICYWIQVAFVQKKYNFGQFSMICANFSLLTLLLLRWKESGHFPLSNLYESLMFLSWSLSTFHLVLENEEIPKKNFQKNSQFFLGALTSPMALFINAFATFRLPEEMQHSSALVPALQSNWLMMHVTVMILSYSALICGSLLSIAFLIFTRNINMDNNVEKTNSELFESVSKVLPTNTFVLPSPNLSDATPLIENSFSSSMLAETLSKSDVHRNQTTSFENFDSLPPTKKKFLENLDNLSYRILGIGFPFLTIGILSGAVWANEAWGSYWSWDPKETWALATWLVFAIYLHTRFTKGWSGKKPAFLASFGFVIVWVCFLGVNLLGEGLHSYGFFSK
uniref:cytochrome c biogenesis protein n=1 Tax=Coelastrum microporum TaxID=55409 RepID=UPI00226CC671|nr:cytochrome c biogenesis protein [Coelastrum microporum]UWM13100.1 cytochrome c biogenesis protein [Coelastrum microporum]